MKRNIRTGLYLLNALKTLELTRSVVAGMTGNAAYPTPPVTMADLDKLADELEALNQQALFGGRQQKLDRDKKLNESREALRSVADYVRSVANGDAAVLASSGFELAKQREPIGIPGTSKRMEARMTGLKGDLELRWSSVHGAHGYQVWMTDQDPAQGGAWQAIGFTTRVRHLVTDLESYKAYWFCVSAIGVAGEGAQCDPAMGRAA